MNKLLMGFLLISTSLAYAHKVELVNADGYMPLAIPPKVVFFITKEYTDDKIAPLGTTALFIVTINCSTNLHRRVLTEIFNPLTNTVHKIFMTNDDIATAMINQEFTKIDPEIIPFATQLCNTLIK